MPENDLDQPASQEQISTPEKNANLEEPDRWWIRHKIALDLSIKILGLIMAFGTICFLYLQIDSASQQTRAMWESFRPALGIVPYKQGDITPFTDSVKVAEGRWLTDSNTFHELRFSIMNYGHSPAQLGTIYFDLVTDAVHLRESTNQEGMQLVQTRVISFDMPVKLNKTQRSYVTISFDYGWDEQPDPPKFWNCTQWYSIYYENKNWRCIRMARETYYKFVDKLRPIEALTR